MIQYKFTEYSMKEYTEYLRLCINTTKQMAIDFELNYDDLKKKFIKLLANHEDMLNDLENNGKVTPYFTEMDDNTPFEIRKKHLDLENIVGYFSDKRRGPFGKQLVTYVGSALERGLIKVKSKYRTLASDVVSSGPVGSEDFILNAKKFIDSINDFEKLTEIKNNYSVSSTSYDELFRVFHSYKKYTNSPLKKEFEIVNEQILEISNYINEIEFKKFNLYPSLALVNLPENSIKSAIKERIESRDIKRNKYDSLLYPEVIQYYTMLETDKILIERGMKDYSMYQVTRSNHNGIDTGSYFYSFDVNENLLMTQVPFQQVELELGTYIVFDKELYRSGEVIIIPKEDIISFKLYGTEMMQSSVTTNSKSMVMDASNNNDLATYNKPSIVGTFFSSMLFGSAYTILNGVGKQMHQQTNVLGNKLDGLSDQINQVVEAINNISITTNHQIIDTSRVQIILTNKRDLEIDGISIYYDLNRVYPNLNNPSNQSVPKHEEKATHSTNMAEEVLKLKELLDQGIIDEEEFKAMKKKLIN